MLMDDLPFEILFKILSNSSFPDLLDYKFVSHIFQVVSNDVLTFKFSFVKKYQIEWTQKSNIRQFALFCDNRLTLDHLRYQIVKFLVHWNDETDPCFVGRFTIHINYDFNLETVLNTIPYTKCVLMGPLGSLYFDIWEKYNNWEIQKTSELFVWNSQLPIVLKK